MPAKRRFYWRIPQDVTRLHRVGLPSAKTTKQLKDHAVSLSSPPETFRIRVFTEGMPGHGNPSAQLAVVISGSLLPPGGPVEYCRHPYLMRDPRINKIVPPLQLFQM